MVALNQIEKFLETYTLEEILEFNEMTEAEALEHLVEAAVVQLPSPAPCDLDE